jgi:hypothetical protein
MTPEEWVNFHERLIASIEQNVAVVEAQQNTDAKVGVLAEECAALAEAQEQAQRDIATLALAQVRTDGKVAELDQSVAESLAAIVEAQRRGEQEIAELRAAQLRTEQLFQRFLESQSGGNGRPRSPGKK